MITKVKLFNTYRRYSQIVPQPLSPRQYIYIYIYYIKTLSILSTNYINIHIGSEKVNLEYNKNNI